MKKHYSVFVILSGIFVFLTIFCSQRMDLGGKYLLVNGECKSKVIMIKKIQGFGRKYHLVSLFENENADRGGKEFLAVNEDNKLTIYNGTRMNYSKLQVIGIIIVNADGLNVTVTGKNCQYKRI